MDTYDYHILKGFDALIRWFFRLIRIEVHCKGVMETLFRFRMSVDKT